MPLPCWFLLKFTSIMQFVDIRNISRLIKTTALGQTRPVMGFWRNCRFFYLHDYEVHTLCLGKICISVYINDHRCIICFVVILLMLVT